MGRTNIELDDRLIEEGLRKTGFQTKRELVHAALESYVRKQDLKALLQLKGKIHWEGNLDKLRRGRKWSS